jgi:hypothetical protein
VSAKLPIRLNRAEIPAGVLLPPEIRPRWPISTILYPVRAWDAEALKRYPVNTWLNGRLSQPRNPKTHRLYFKVIAIAAALWPEGHEPEPKGDADHLRAWLQCKAGCCHWYDFRTDDTDTVIAFMKDIRGEGKFAFAEGIQVTPLHGGSPPIDKLRIYVPDTIEYDAMGEDKFRPIKDAVFEIIEMVLGVKVEILLKNAEHAGIEPGD